MNGLQARFDRSRRDPYKGGVRPFLVLSNDTRLYYGEDYTLAVLTTTEFNQAIRLEAGNVIEGGLRVYPSFVKSWSLHEFTHDEIHRRVAQVLVAFLEDTAIAAYEFMVP